ncbi:hypothetical protein EMUCRT_0041 [Ehrlichia cf. muris str. EmCRT]|uniref:Uncharacterized protein n=1 Tax=Ehrlichia cf. muris str. EmCRT TaxID=1359167 RepID=A0A0F3NCU4_9RICK|nr:hypothetical protein EMUCRT_0041 [Ehrlichia cf. muris str. EmCRT]
MDFIINEVLLCTKISKYIQNLVWWCCRILCMRYKKLF